MEREEYGASIHRENANPRIVKQPQINVAMALATGGVETERLAGIRVVVVNSQPNFVSDS